MNIIIAGCGKIGSTVLSSLVSEGHDLTAIDTDSEVISELTNIYDVIGACGSAVDCEILKAANVENAELFVAATGSDELNMLSCFMAKKLGAKNTIARIRNPEFNDSSLGFIKQHLDLSMAINPELLAAQEIYNILKLPAAAKIETFSRRNFEMIELKLKPDSILNDVSLSEMRLKYKGNYLVCAVQRGENVFIPKGDFVLKSDDRIGLTASPSEILKLLRMLGGPKKQARDVMILGGSKTAYYLSRVLLATGNTVKIIEKDADKCSELATKLQKAVIINADGAQQEILLEEGIKDLDAFVALTGMDEENILLSYFALSQNVQKVISKINRDEFVSTAEKLGLDCIVSPKSIVADILVRYARALQNSLGSNVETLYKLMDGKAEALEFSVNGESDFTSVPLKNLKIRKNILIAGIIRNRKPIIPDGEEVILPGDKVIVLATDQRLHDLSNILI